MDGLTGFMAGGGTAISLDATAVYNNAFQKNVGNDNKKSDWTIAKDLTILKQNNTIVVDVIFDQVNEGGTATATTGDSFIKLSGTSTAIITTGGGVAAAWHSYTNRDNTDTEGTKNNGQPGGSAEAIAKTGNVTMSIDLTPSTTPDASAISTGIKTAVSSLTPLFSQGGLTTENASNAMTALGNAAGTLYGQGMAVGLLGGGMAVSVSDGGTRTTSSVDNVTIDLNSGYVVGTFGGGMSVNVYNKSTMSASASGQMKSLTEARDVTINVDTSGKNDKAIGVFAGGVAVSSEYGWKIPDETNLLTASESVSLSTVDSAAITVAGNVDGVFGGGLAIGNSNITPTGIDARVDVNGTSAITVNGGTVDVLNLEPIMKATQKSGSDPAWSFIGHNASFTMVNLKGITDRTAIAGGGMALGMSAKAGVKDSVITITDGTIKGDILGGGIAVDQLFEEMEGGASVGTSTITLNGGTIEGSVYAGGAISHNMQKAKSGYDKGVATSSVDTSVVTLNGAKVAGEISGQGYELKTGYTVENNYNPFTAGNVEYTKAAYNESVTKSTLNITGSNTLSPIDTSAFATDGLTGDGSKIHSFDAINVAAGSVTKLVGEIGGIPLILGDGASVMTVDQTAVLDIHDATFTGEGKVADKFAKGSTFWTDSNVKYDALTKLVDLTSEGGSFKIAMREITTDADKKEGAKRLSKRLGAEPLQALIDDGYALDWQVPKVRSGAKTFFQDWNDAAPTLNATYGRAALLGEDAAVTATTVAISRVVTDSLTSRLSYIGDFSSAPGSYGETGAVWAQYLRNDFKAEGLSSSFGSIDADGDFNGVMAGADFAVVGNGNARAGAAFYYLNGDADGTISSNDYDGWGFSLYGNYRSPEYGFNVIGDLGYGRVSNEIEGHINAKKVETDRDLNVFTAGVKVEKQFQVAEHCFVVPYTGIRYFNVDAKDYDTTYGGEHLFGNSSDKQNIWTLPLGVSTSHNFVTQSGWTFTPKFDVAYIWAFGDKDNDVKVDMGTSAESALNYKVVDDGSWRGAVGVDASYGSWGFALGYSYQKGDDIKDQKWFVNASYAF